MCQNIYANMVHSVDRAVVEWVERLSAGAGGCRLDPNSDHRLKNCSLRGELVTFGGFKAA